MKIAIVGAGAIGGYLGARLAHAGEEVTFIARNRNLAAINARGFRLLLEDGGELHALPAPTLRAVEQMNEAGPQDVVLLTVKAHQIDSLLPHLRELFGPRTMLVSMINGLPWWYFQGLSGPHADQVLHSVDPGGHIAALIEPQRIIGCVVYPAAELLEPGVVKVIEGKRFTLGELSGERSPRIEALSHCLMNAGFKAPISRDIRGEIWVKLWGNLSFNPISALTHATLQDICTFPATRALAAAMMGEAQTVAEKLGVVFRLSLEQRIDGAHAVGAHKTSMLQDLEHGRVLELQALVGAVVELARLTDTPTPHIDAIYAASSLLAYTALAQRSAVVLQAL